MFTIINFFRPKWT